MKRLAILAFFGPYLFLSGSEKTEHKIGAVRIRESDHHTERLTEKGWLAETVTQDDGQPKYLCRDNKGRYWRFVTEVID